MASSLVAPVPGIYLGSRHALDAPQVVGVRHVVALTAVEPVTSLSYSHLPPLSGGSSTADTVLWLRTGCKLLGAALDHCGPVLVCCTRGPQQGGASGAVGVAHLLLTGGCSSLREALDKCQAWRPRSTLLAALVALELQTLGGVASDLPIENAAHWLVEQGDEGAPVPLAPLPLPLDEGTPPPPLHHDESIAVCRGAAMRVRRISAAPQLAAVSGFVSSAEARHLAQLARTQLAPSQVARGEDVAADAARAWRSSSSCSLGRGHGQSADAVVARVVERAAYLSGLSAMHAEEVQVVAYTPGQQYREHCDYFSPTQDATYAERTGGAGNRLVSLFCCLAPCELGGATAFPELRLRFGLREGEALLWMNVDKTGRLDRRTLHAGRPVEQGEKLGMNVWLRQRPYEQVEEEGEEGREGHGARAETNVQRGPWKPARAPPRQTQASPGAQTSTETQERLC